MDRIIERVVFNAPTKPNAKRVAAYSRVSSGKDAMLHSLSAQVSYYSNLIQNHEGWIYCGVYADEALTGTKDSRANFVRLIDDCRAGKVDLVITKSISRFARNTVTLLETVRELKALGIGVYFEEQNINSLTADGELMLTILASYAQEESLSASENQKWRIQKDYQQGILPLCHQHIYGYKRTPDCGLEIVPEEAEIVREIFTLYNDGFGMKRIADLLNERGVPSNTSDRWSECKVGYIISNEKYVGDLLLQKFYLTDHLTKKKKRNDGERKKYYVADNHEPIVSRELFDQVQTERERRKEKHCKYNGYNEYTFTRKIVCGNCGKFFRRKVTQARIVWICHTFDKHGKDNCSAKQIPEDTLYKATAEVIGISDFDNEIFAEKIEKIIVPKANVLRFVFKDGHEVETTWKDRSRSESWTAEMKEQARQRALKGVREKCQQ